MSTDAQLPLEFNHRPALSGDDFLVAPGNRDAVNWLDRWPGWPAPGLAIYGPAGCGKTHLAQVFMAASGSLALAREDLASKDPAGSGLPYIPAEIDAFVIEDTEDLIAGGLEEALLHLYNHIAETGRHLLLSARQPPSRWAVTLPDLRSRLNAVPTVEIRPPDDTLMSAVLVKLFADRQLRVDADVVPFMSVRMERSFAAARDLVSIIDRAALEKHRNITVPLVRQVLNETQS